MTETATVSAAASTPKKPLKAKKSAKVKGVSKNLPATHPPTSTMVNNAIKNLKERGGSSSQAIKKYISSTYKVDAEKIAPFIKKYLKSAADKGLLIRTKGKGASGSFKLPSAVSEGAKKSVAKKVKSASKPKKVKVSAAKKEKSPTKPKAKKPKSAKKASKAKKATKAPAAKKLKSPKPKKVSKPKKPALKK